MPVLRYGAGHRNRGVHRDKSIEVALRNSPSEAGEEFMKVETKPVQQRPDVVITLNADEADRICRVLAAPPNNRFPFIDDMTVGLKLIAYIEAAYRS
jgi:hypothetical protein